MLLFTTEDSEKENEKRIVNKAAFRFVDPRLPMYCNNQKSAKDYFILIFQRKIYLELDTRAAPLMYSSYTIASNNRVCGLQIKKRQTTTIRFNQSSFSVPTMIKQPPPYSAWERF
ncbi:hypothetical protein QTP88_012222 [Uroleucon formosanum]